MSVPVLHQPPDLKQNLDMGGFPGNQKKPWIRHWHCGTLSYHSLFDRDPPNSLASSDGMSRGMPMRSCRNLYSRSSGSARYGNTCDWADIACEVSS